MPCPGQRRGGWRSGISAGLGWVERVPVEGGTQHCCWRPAPPGREESRGDGGQRVGDPGAGMGCRTGPFDRSVGRRVLQPADGDGFGCRPGRRFPGSGAEVQAFAGRADELGPVTVRQAPGDERPRPGPASRMPADLERAVTVRPAADRMDTDIKHVHGSQPPSATPARQRLLDRPLWSPADPESKPRVRRPSGRSTRHQERLPRRTRIQPRAGGCQLTQPAGYGRRQPRRGSATECVSAVYSAPNDLVRLRARQALSNFRSPKGRDR